MNERISELAGQAWDYALYHETVNGKAAFNSFINKNFSDLLLEKFAELIVLQCIEICNSRVGNSDYNTGRMHCVSDLKEHFGLGMSVEDKKQLIKDLLGVQK